MSIEDEIKFYNLSAKIEENILLVVCIYSLPCMLCMQTVVIVVLMCDTVHVVLLFLSFRVCDP